MSELEDGLRASLRECIQHHRHCRRWAKFGAAARTGFLIIGGYFFASYLSDLAPIDLLASIVQFTVAWFFHKDIRHWEDLAESWAIEVERIQFLMIVKHGYEVD